MIGDGLPFAPKLYSENMAIRVVLLRMNKLEEGGKNLSTWLCNSVGFCSQNKTNRIYVKVVSNSFTVHHVTRHTQRTRSDSFPCFRCSRLAPQSHRSRRFCGALERTVSLASRNRRLHIRCPVSGGGGGVTSGAADQSGAAPGGALPHATATPPTSTPPPPTTATPPPLRTHWPPEHSSSSQGLGRRKGTRRRRRRRRRLVSVWSFLTRSQKNTRPETTTVVLSHTHTHTRTRSVVILLV